MGSEMCIRDRSLECNADKGTFWHAPDVLADGISEQIRKQCCRALLRHHLWRHALGRVCRWLRWHPEKQSCGTNKRDGTSCWACCDDRTHTGSLAMYICVEQSGDVVFEATSSSIVGVSSGRLRPTAPSPRSSLTASCDAAGLSNIGRAFSDNCDSVDHGASCLLGCAAGYTISGDPAVRTCNNAVLEGSSLPDGTDVQCTLNLPNGAGVEHNCAGVSTRGRWPQRATLAINRTPTGSASSWPSLGAPRSRLASPSSTGGRGFFGLPGWYRLRRHRAPTADPPCRGRDVKGA